MKQQPKKKRLPWWVTEVRAMLPHRMRYVPLSEVYASKETLAEALQEATRHHLQTLFIHADLGGAFRNLVNYFSGKLGGEPEDPVATIAWYREAAKVLCPSLISILRLRRQARLGHK